MLKIIEAIKTGDIAYIKKALKGDTDWLRSIIVDKDGYEALAIHYACFYGELFITHLLLEKKPELLDAINVFNQTPISFAARSGNQSLVEYLAKRGANLSIAINKPTSFFHGFLPIHFAASRGHLAVLQCLIDHGADINIRVGAMKYHLIHIASSFGQLEILTFLLNKNADLLNLLDGDSQTPVALAAAKGHDGVVAYFISKNANLDIATPLKRAMDGGYYEAANLIILKKNAHRSKDSILPFVQTGIQAICLMMKEPALIPIFMGDKRVVHLLKIPHCTITEQSIDFYKFRGRRPSWFVRIDQQRKTFRLFKPDKELGSGGYGLVRKFLSDDGQAIAVKSFTDQMVVDLSPARCRSIERKIYKEAQFNNRAYPSHKYSETFWVSWSKRDSTTYSTRYVMDYVQGETAELFIPKTSCPHELALITLLIAQELQRIHNRGIIHGDLNLKNMMIHRSEGGVFTVHIIDFGLSYSMSDDSPRYFDHYARHTWVAPELCDKNTRVKPDPSQDIYSLGFSLNKIFCTHQSNIELMLLFPSIQNFISCALMYTPRFRPSLDLFCKDLHYALFLKTDARLDRVQARDRRALADQTPHTNRCCSIM